MQNNHLLSTIQHTDKTINVETILSKIDDIGIDFSLTPGTGLATQAQRLRDILSGTEHLIDTNPAIAWHWGFLSCLELTVIVADLTTSKN